MVPYSLHRSIEKEAHVHWRTKQNYTMNKNVLGSNRDLMFELSSTFVPVWLTWMAHTNLPGCPSPSRWLPSPPLVKMETDRIRMKSDSDSIFYHILNRILMRIQIFSDTNAKWMPRIQILIRILT